MLTMKMPSRIIACLVFALAACAGCFSREPMSLTSHNAPQKIPAIKNAAEQGDRQAIPQLVRDLDSEDPAVRFYAIEGLERLTGETFGYLYYQDYPARRPAVLKWREWLNGHPVK